MEDSENQKGESRSEGIEPFEAKEMYGSIPPGNASPVHVEIKEETTADSQPQTQNSPLQIENMEVHKHPHHVSHKKKWSEYLLEFAMIFFAVFLGFIAENIRENTVDRRKEREYIKSMIEDLKTDTAKIAGYARMRANKIKMMDSLATLLVLDDKRQAGDKIYYFARYVTVTFPLITSDGTLQQLKNSGGLRLIKKQLIVDSILKYDGNVKYMQYLNSATEQIENTFRQIAGEAFDTRYFKFDYADISKKSTGNPTLLTSDRSELNKIAMQVEYEATALERDVQNAHGLEARAIRLLELLKKEYHL